MVEQIDAVTAARRAKIELAKFDERIKNIEVDKVELGDKGWVVDLSYTAEKQAAKKRILIHPVSAKVLAISNQNA
ncbi:MAG TPA: hypothetical protein VK158_00280 [Acidobacteriota bacterium]|nr:hypothetical protein [Acidobacteriota bacterium]